LIVTVQDAGLELSAANLYLAPMTTAKRDLPLRRAVAFLLLSGLVLLLAVLPTGAAPETVTVKIAGADGGTEPRIAIAPDGKRWLVSNAGGAEMIYSSADGSAWKPTASQPQQSMASIDVDIVTTRTGRIIASELDFSGINFYTSYSDDGGKTWTSSSGTKLADQDRQWLAVGPDDPVTHQPRVYLLYHNLLSGAATHNMWVMTSTDNGATFGLPVPVTLPGDQAWLDLQCADSGGPSSISVDQKTGNVVVAWGTRSSPAGGCAAQPFEINVVGATRVWTAHSPDGSLGSWTTSLAVDDSVKGNLVGMQLAPATIGRDGTVYLVYPESPNGYPDYDGAAIRVKWAPADLSHWSDAVTIAPQVQPGNVLPHIVAGDAGKIDVAWFAGKKVGQKIAWYLKVAQSLDLFAAKPTFRMSYEGTNPTYTGTASELMGACSGNTPTAGAENGFACNRSTDVWGFALDHQCRYMVAWPTVKNTAPHNDRGTFATTQTSGPTVCATVASSKPVATPITPKKKPAVRGTKLTRGTLPGTGVGDGGFGLILLALAGAVSLLNVFSRRQHGSAGV